MNDLCADAGVKKGSLYHFFPTKRDLALAAIDLHWERHRTGLFEKAFAPDVPPLDQINRFFQLLTPWTRALEAEGKVCGCPFGNLGLEMATQDEVIRDKILVIFGHITSYLTRAIEHAREAGDVGEAAYFVRDNGVGFDPRDVRKLFSSFQRLHRMTELEGVGVGLATVDRIVRRHGGRVWTSSREGEGATVYFALGPLAASG